MMEVGVVVIEGKEVSNEVIENEDEKVPTCRPARSKLSIIKNRRKRKM
jgi:hypothetical protein